MSIKINDKKKTIEVTKSFLKAASIFGSDDYKEYQAAKKDNPGYRVVTKSHRTASTNSVPNLSYEDMEKYIIPYVFQQINYTRKQQTGQPLRSPGLAFIGA